MRKDFIAGDASDAQRFFLRRPRKTKRDFIAQKTRNGAEVSLRFK